jgi:hypothetical protein
MKSLILFLALIFVFACSEQSSEDLSAKIVLENPVQTAVIGQSLSYQLEDFPLESDAYPRLLFQGVFTTASGTAVNVETILPAQYDLRGTDDLPETWLRLPRLGAFLNPFTQTADHGTFQGTITPLLEMQDGQMINGNQSPYTLEIAPSLSFLKLEPTHANCGIPALRILPSMPYRLQVQASGIEAIRFEYSISEINGKDGLFPTIIHTYNTPTQIDQIGEQEPLVFNAIPDDVQMAVVSIRVKAFNQNGQFVENAIPMTVHRPMELQYDGNTQLAQVFDPVPVTGCMFGGIGTEVSYSETVSETKQQSVSVTISNQWNQAQTNGSFQSFSSGIRLGESSSSSSSRSDSIEREVSQGWGLSYEQSQSNSVSFASSTGANWTSNTAQGQSESSFQENFQNTFGSEATNITVDNSWEISIPLIGSAGVKDKKSTNVVEGHSNGVTNGSSSGSSSSKNYEVSSSTGNGSSFGSVTTQGQRTSVSGAYALASLEEVTQSERNGQSIDKTWDLEKGVSFSDSQSEGGRESMTKSMENSKTYTESRSISGSIPKGRVGIFYRQTSRWVKEAELVTYDLCGKSKYMGSLYFNEWQWAPELALGTECDLNPPKSKFTSATCYIEPCE